ncbi:MAG: electron transfer flavoprotein subunit alpha/FixB family protein [Candidatus Gastranaerophilales bacterium]|nr:electron transfer flavoprotein subunit alpha/FixB family protein [Candidatus Gastranaerophilales bacterium]
MKKLAIYVEKEGNTLIDASYELISKACELKAFAKSSKDMEIEVTAVLVSSAVDENDVKKAFLAGADNFILIKNDDFQVFNQMKYSSAFLSYFHENYHDYILFPATPTGRMIAPRVTTVLNTGLVADCTGLEFIIKDGLLKLASTRPTFGAELMATILSKQSPECATIRPKTFKADFRNTKIGTYKEFPCSIENNFDLILLDSTKDEAQKINFDTAKVIFSAGYGLYDGKDNIYIEKLYQITQKLNIGFALTRKLVDLGIKSSQYQIGQTGMTATPELYVAFGISGTIQHIAGMKNSKIIIAINNDENAEIFKYSDYKIVTDARAVIDDLFEKTGAYNQ